MNPRIWKLFLDFFAGGGGASTGILRALNREVDIAVNHSRKALWMHMANHPETSHLLEDVFSVDPLLLSGGQPVGGAWFSPDCTHFSAARGGKPKSKKVRGLAWVVLRCAVLTRPEVMFLENVTEFKTWGPVLEDGSRCRENVGRTFQCFHGALTTGIAADHPDLAEIREVLGNEFAVEKIISGLGYNVEWRELIGYHYGAKTIRKRLFMIARCDGQPIVWPEPTHDEPTRARVNGRKPWGTAAECIDFTIPCPSIFLSPAEAKVLRLKRPLAEASNRRIAKGVWRYVMNAERPFLVCLTHAGGDRVESVDEPCRTVTSANRGEKGLVDAFVAAPFATEHAQASGQRNFSIEEPMRTQCAGVKGGHFAVVCPVLAGVGGRAAQSPPRSVDEPFATLTAKADGVVAAVHVARQFGTAIGRPGDVPDATGTGRPKSQVVASFVARQFGASIGQKVESPAPTNTAGGGGKSQLVSAFVAQHNTGVVGHTVEEPVSTLTQRGTQQQIVSVSLLKYYGADQDPQMEEPVHTGTTKARFGVSEATMEIPPLTPEREAMARRVAAFLRQHGIVFEGEFATTKSGLVIFDIGMRMFVPRELYRAQGFPEGYIIDPIVDGKPMSKTDQIELCGNSVCPPVAEALVRANCPEMAVKEKEEAA